MNRANLFCSLFFHNNLIFYPKATSKTIINTNPTIKPNVDKFLFSFIDSGNSSLEATISIAPAANASKNGSILLIDITLVGINVRPLVLRDKNVIILLVAVSFLGFLSCKDFIALRPNGVAALPRPKIFATIFEDIYP